MGKTFTGLFDINKKHHKSTRRTTVAQMFNTLSSNLRIFYQDTQGRSLQRRIRCATILPLLRNLANDRFIRHNKCSMYRYS